MTTTTEEKTVVGGGVCCIVVVVIHRRDQAQVLVHGCHMLTVADLAALVRPSLGPKALSKMLFTSQQQGGDASGLPTLTCDALSMLRSLLPGPDASVHESGGMSAEALLLVEACTTLERHTGDGTTSFILLCNGILLRCRPREIHSSLHCALRALHR